MSGNLGRNLGNVGQSDRGQGGTGGVDSPLQGQVALRLFTYFFNWNGCPTHRMALGGLQTRLTAVMIKATHIYTNPS